MKKKIITAMIAWASMIWTDAIGQWVDTDTKNNVDTIENLSAYKKKDLAVNLWFNALESAISDKGNARLRWYANIWLSYKTIEVWYEWMNQFNENLKNYFARHVATAWIKNKDLKLIWVVKTDKDGIINDQYWLRYMISDKLWIDYWRVDIVWSKEWANATFFLGKSLWKSKTSIELFESIDISKKWKIAPYTELQVNQEIAKWFNVFIRGEMAWVSYKDNVYLLGVSKKF